MKILIISPNGKTCGVSDYSIKLAENLEKIGIDSEILDFYPWRIHFFKEYFSKVFNSKCDYVNIQYPSPSFGRNVTHIIFLLALSLQFKTVLTVHEFSQSHSLRKISILLIALLSRKVIFTNKFEMNQVVRFLPFVKKKFSVIPISSNIPKSKLCFEEKTFVTFFGLIRPEKGLEEFIELIKLLSKTQTNFLILGSLNQFTKDYGKKMILTLNSFKNVEVKLNLSPEKVAENLARSHIAYLHYPDGLSERRGSFLAAVNNDVLVISNEGKQTTKELKEMSYIINSPREVADFISRGIDKDEFFIKLQNARAWIHGRSWEEISLSYKIIISSI